MSLKERVREYFSFTPGERRGVVILLLLLFIISGVRLLFPILSTPPVNSDMSIQIMALKSKKKDKYFVKEDNGRSNTKLESEKVRKEVLFDPNTATFEQLMDIGFSQYAVRNLIKYREHGGQIKAKEDLNKIYGIDSIFLSEINHLIVIQEIDIVVKSQELGFIVDVNLADSAELKRLPCLGSKLSSRILKYRNSLGGFYDVAQVAEVYGVDSACYHQIKKSMVLNKADIHKLDLNTVTEKELFRHPYISKYQARAIVKYRKLVGEFTSLEQLRVNNIFSTEEYLRVLNYLTINR